MERIEMRMNEIFKNENVVDVSIRYFDKKTGKQNFQLHEKKTIEYKELNLKEIIGFSEILQVKSSNYAYGLIKIAFKNENFLQTIQVQTF